MSIFKFRKYSAFDRFFKGITPTSEPITLNHSRIFILPSSRGIAFMILALILLLIAFVYNDNLVYLLSFLLISIFLVAILHSFRSLSGLIVQEGQTHAVFAGDSAIFEIHLNNTSKIRRSNLQLELGNIFSLDMDAQSKSSARLSSLTSKRGWHYCDTITISSSFPLGLFRAWAPLRFNLKTLVYPRPLSQERSFPVTQNASDKQGVIKKGVDDFYGLQNYQQGDSIKHVFWKAYAKGQGLYSKQYSGEQSSELWLDYEATYGLPPEDRLSQLCRWVLDAEKLGLHYGLLLPNLKITPGVGDIHKAKCLEALALF